MWKQYRPYVGFSAAALAVGGLSALLTSGGMKEFAALNQPPLSPPGWLFPVVWTLLYALMGISSYIVWDSRSEYTKEALTIYGIQLAFNFCWSIFFFVMESFLLSLVWLGGLFVIIFIMIAAFWRINRVAAYLQIPYAVWVLFAGYLNAGIYFLN